MSDSRDVVTPLASPTSGTDFVPFATGGGANIESMPAYLADPQLQTGNLPGLARANFNNRTLRQGAFVAAGVSTFIYQTLSIYVPDDGNMANWVANFKAALQAFITPGGTLPGGPYLPLSGGTMAGNINFQAGSTVVLANNTYLRALDVGGTAHGLERMGTDGNHYINDGTSPLVIFGTTPTIGSGLYWSARDTGGTNHGLLGIMSDNNTYLSAFGNLNIAASTIYANANIVIPNTNSYYAKNSAGAIVGLLGVNAQNLTQIGLGAPADTGIYCAAGSHIILNGATNVTGTFNPQGAVTIGGTLTVAGTVTLSSSLQVNGATNLYSRLNVNNSVGATITGDILTTTLHVTGTTQLDQTLNVTGQSSFYNTQIYQPGINDPLNITVDNGHYARTRYTVSGSRTWSCGTAYTGDFWITDESAGRLMIQCSTNGDVYIPGSMHGVNWYGSNVVVNGVYIGGTSNFYDGGGNWITSGANLHMGGSLQIDGNGQVNGNFNCSNTISSNVMNCNGGTVNGNYQVNAHMQVNGDTNINGTMATGAGVSVGWHCNINGGMCLGGGAFNMDYTVGFAYNNHTQWYNGLGCYAQFFAPYSDERYKSNLQERAQVDALAAILPIKFFSYDTPHAGPDGGEINDPAGHREMGFTAQNVRESLADAVIETTRITKFNMDHVPLASGDPAGCDWETEPALALDPMTMIAYAMRAIQQLSARVQQLEGRA